MEWPAVFEAQPMEETHQINESVVSKPAPSEKSSSSHVSHKMSTSPTPEPFPSELMPSSSPSPISVAPAVETRASTVSSSTPPHQSSSPVVPSSLSATSPTTVAPISSSPAPSFSTPSSAPATSSASLVESFTKFKEENDAEEEDHSWARHWTPIFGSFVVDSQRDSKNQIIRCIFEELNRIYDELTDLLSSCSVSIAKLRCIFDDALSPSRVYFSMELLQELRSYLTTLTNTLPLVKTRLDQTETKDHSAVLLLGGMRSLLLVAHECASETSYFFETLHQELQRMTTDPKLQTLDPASGYYYLQASKIYSVYYDHMKSFTPTMKQLRTLSQIFNYLPSLSSKASNAKTRLRFPFYPVDDFLASTGLGLIKTDAYVPVPVDFGNISLGFEYDKHLKDYSKSLKTVYCAMSTHEKVHGKSSSSPWNSTFSMAFVNYFLNESRRDEEIDKIMTQISVEFLKDAWCLLEDPAVHLLLKSYNLFWAKEVAVDKDLLIPIEPLSSFFSPSSSSGAPIFSPSSSPAISASPAFSSSPSFTSSYYSTSSSSSIESIKAKYISFQPRIIDTRYSPEDIEASISLTSSSTANASSSTPSLLPHSTSTENFLVYLLQRFANRNMSQRMATGESAGEREVLSEDSGVGEGPEFEMEFPSSSSSSSSSSTKTLPGAIVLHIHGGGFIAQSPKSHSFYMKDWVNQTGLPIISLNYSKAPEHPYPTAVDEAFELYKWLLEPRHLSSLGISVCPNSPHKIVLVGDSAGANLCCAVTLKAIVNRVPVPTGLLLHYPVVNITESVSISRLMFANDPVLTSHTLKVCLDSYLPSHLRPTAMRDPFISPGFADERLLKRFPPTIIGVGDIDPLVDDATFFAYRLLRAGCDVQLKVYRGLPHGYLNLGFVLPASISAIRESGEFLSKLLDQDDLLIKSFEVLSCEDEEELENALDDLHNNVDPLPNQEDIAEMK